MWQLWTNEKDILRVQIWLSEVFYKKLGPINDEMIAKNISSDHDYNDISKKRHTTLPDRAWRLEVFLYCFIFVAGLKSGDFNFALSQWIMASTLWRHSRVLSTRVCSARVIEAPDHSPISISIYWVWSGCICDLWPTSAS